MGQYSWEKRLSILYLSGAVLGIITTICSVIPSVHWEEILDNCITSHCSCVLYGSYTFTFFNGGQDELCHVIKFSSIPSVIIGVGLAAYHGYRVFISKPKSNRRQNNRSGKVIVVQGSANDVEIREPACHCWILYVLIASCTAGLLIATAVILSDGYLKTCGEYRKQIVQLLPATGSSARVIYDRLSCSSIFDFMDYLEPFTRPFAPREENVYHSGPYEERDFRRGDIINTAASLLLAIFSAWLNSVIWILIVVCNIMLSKLNKVCCKI